MDSLAVSAIGLAAGGWQNVKLVGIYSSTTTGIPNWKLGICSILTLLANASITNSSANAHGGFQTVLIAPNNGIGGYSGTTNVGVTFSTNAIKRGENGTLGFVAVLFTW